jgi:glucokinase
VGVDVGQALRARWPGIGLWLGNDATGAAWAEHAAGAGRGGTDLMLVALGTGIGGGLVRAGALDGGAHGYAGEFGHMVVDPRGPLCPCGKQGCWERLASGSGLGVLGREAATAGRAPRVVALAGGDPEAVRGEHVTAAAAAGDADAQAVMDRFGWWLALGMANLVAALDPGLVVVGGGLSEAGEVLLGPTRRAFADLVEGGARRGEVPIVAAAFGARSGAVGAALLAAAAGA